MGFEDESSIHYVCNGQEIVDAIKKKLQSITNLENFFEITDWQPISAVFLDYQMPLLNGFKAIEEVEKVYNSLNKKLIQNYKS